MLAVVDLNIIKKILLLSCSLRLDLPKSLRILEHILLQFLLSPQKLSSLIFDEFELLSALNLHLPQLVFILFHKVLLFRLICLAGHRGVSTTHHDKLFVLDWLIRRAELDAVPVSHYQHRCVLGRSASCSRIFQRRPVDHIRRVTQ